MKQLCYDMWSAMVSHNVTEHPQIQMKNLGFQVIHSVPQSIADCWWFTVEDFDFSMPPYLREMEYNLNYWMHECHKDCEYFNKEYKTQEDKQKYCCYGGTACKKEKINGTIY